MVAPWFRDCFLCCCYRHLNIVVDTHSAYLINCNLFSQPVFFAHGKGASMPIVMVGWQRMAEMNGLWQFSVHASRCGALLRVRYSKLALYCYWITCKFDLQPIQDWYVYIHSIFILFGWCWFRQCKCLYIVWCDDKMFHIPVVLWATPPSSFSITSFPAKFVCCL